MNILNLKLIIILIVMAGLLGACSGTEASREEPEVKEDLEVVVGKMTYDIERKSLIVDYTTNIEAGTEVYITLNGPEIYFTDGDFAIVGEQPDRDYAEFYMEEETFKGLSSGAYFLEVTIDVSSEDEENTDFFISNTGGFSEELIKQYEGSQTVQILSEGDYSSMEFSVKIKSTDYEIENELAVEDVKVEAIIEEESYSSDFLLYNTKYYEAYKIQMDLIAANFEILAMDGFENKNIVDDLLHYTLEFNEILDIYSKESLPITSVDQKLHNLTLEMIEEQQHVNNSITSGLQEENVDYFYPAGEHMGNVRDIYLEGYNLLDE